MTGTLAGFDAFWVERIKKEGKTQMRHQEQFQIVNKQSLQHFYQQMHSYSKTNKQLENHGRQIVAASHLSDHESKRASTP